MLTQLQEDGQVQYTVLIYNKIGLSIEYFLCSYNSRSKSEKEFEPFVVCCPVSVLCVIQH